MKTILILMGYVVIATHLLHAQSPLNTSTLNLSSQTTNNPSFKYPGCQGEVEDFSNQTCLFYMFGKDFTNYLNITEEDTPECKTQTMILNIKVEKNGTMLLEGIEGEADKKYKNLIENKFPNFNNYLLNENKIIQPAKIGIENTSSNTKIPFVIHSKGHHFLERFSKDGINYKAYINCTDIFVYDESNTMKKIHTFSSKEEYNTFKNSVIEKKD